MPVSESDKLTFALVALKNIAGMARMSHNDDILDIAESTVRVIEGGPTISLETIINDADNLRHDLRMEQREQN